jgi:hypothetical protein
VVSRFLSYPSLSQQALAVCIGKQIGVGTRDE